MKKQGWWASERNVWLNPLRPRWRKTVKIKILAIYFVPPFWCEHKRLKSWNDSVIMVIDLSGMKVGLKSYVWFQNRTSVQLEFDLKSQVWFQTEIALHSVQLALYYIHFHVQRACKAKFWEQKLQNLSHRGFLCLSFSCNFIGYFKQALKSDLFCFSVLFSLAVEKVRFRAENSSIRELIALLRANQIARITSDF